MIENRIKKLKQILSQKNLSAFLVASEQNVFYLSGFRGSDSFILITPKKNFFVTDARYVLQAQKLKKDYEIIQYQKSLIQTFCKILNEEKAKNLGIASKNINLDLFLTLKKTLTGIKLCIMEPIVEQLRVLKNQAEVALIKKSAQIAKQTLNFAKKKLKLRLTERELQVKLEYFMRVLGAEKSAFDIIVASGRNAAMPHALVSDKKIVPGAPVIIDLGCVYQGYSSDLTITCVLGKMNSTFKKYYRIVKAAQLNAISKVRPGVRISEIDLAARSVLTRYGLGKYFTHSTGHGVGIAVHESPVISSKNSNLLKPGMVFTIEPAVYLPAWGGIRIENMVCVTEKGSEVLS
ncbi:MAG: aminopeptidase P family protein [Candidatus Omnitrophota bacterium]